jgi:protein-tyrosine phosphatase
MLQWWIQEPLLLATGNPTDELLAALRRHGFGVIVSLLDDRQLPAYDIARATDAGWIRHKIPVADGGTPSVQQMDEFVQLVRTLPAGAKALVHCETGGSRSGVMGAAYWVDHGLPVAEAIARVCASNPEVQITPERKEALERFAACGLSPARS